MQLHSMLVHILETINGHGEDVDHYHAYIIGLCDEVARQLKEPYAKTDHSEL